MIDLARAMAHDPQLLVLDEITAALPSDLAERVFTVMRALARARALRSVHHAPARRGGRHLRPGDDPSRRAKRGDDRPAGGRRDADRRAHARARGRARGGDAHWRSRTRRRPDARKARPSFRSSPSGSGGSRTCRSRCAAARSSASPRSRARGRTSSSPRCRDRNVPTRGQIHARGELLRAANAVRRDPARSRAGAAGPAARAPAAAAGRREHRGTAVQHAAPLGADQHARRAAADRDGDRRPADRHARPAAGAPALRRQPAEGDDRRWLATGFDALLCYDPTRGIDVGTKRQVYALLRRLADDGAGVLFFSSELAEFPLVCDRVVTLFGGRITAELRRRDGRRGSAAPRDARARRGGRGRVSVATETTAARPAFDVAPRRAAARLDDRRVRAPRGARPLLALEHDLPGEPSTSSRSPSTRCRSRSWPWARRS